MQVPVYICVCVFVYLSDRKLAGGEGKKTFKVKRGRKGKLLKRQKNREGLYCLDDLLFSKEEYRTSVNT